LLNLFFFERTQEAIFTSWGIFAHKNNELSVFHRSIRVIMC